MYKIYINENILELKDTKDVKKGRHTAEAVLAPYSGKKPMLLSYVDMLEKTNRFKHIVIHHNNVKQLWKDTKSLFSIIEAGGGVVCNEKDEVLFIYRKGFWDLPKGKRDPGEKKRMTALREVEEETGVKNVSIHDKIIVTYHLFKLRSKKRALKKTHWYTMKASDQILKPQAEEDITKAEWKNPEKFIKKDIKMYISILEVTKTYLRDFNN